MDKILLVGNPNVGKSVIFSRLTGVRVIISNYPGTTVEFREGKATIGGRQYMVIDVPGTYSLKPTCEAERVAVKMVDEIAASGNDNDIVINVIDSTNLERNLNLTLELIDKDVRMLGCLNIWDERKHHGIEIDVGGLEKETGIIFVPTVGITGEGIKDLIDSFGKAKKGSLRTAEEGRWKEIGKIIQKVQTINYRRHTFLERLEELSVQPWSGIPIALMILGAVFWIIRTIGEGIIAYIAEPLFEILWTPVVLRLSSVMGGSGFIHDIIIGKLVNGGVDYGESLGLLTTGLFVPLASVLPYVFGFYLVVSFLEDFGYLPRLSVLVDNLMHKLGVHGYSVIPFMLGFGCNVPGMLATRVMENKRERFIVATLTAVAIPCMAQIAMVFGLLGDHGNWPFFAVFFVLFLVWFTLGVIMNRLVKGQTPELFVEIPPYRIPYFKALVKKVLMRVRWFIKEAVPWVLAGVLIINLLYVAGVIAFMGKLLGPFITAVFGLPPGAVAALLIGFLRKDVAVGMLVPLDLTVKQLIIASVVLTMYFPCVATFTVMFKEFGIKQMTKAAIIMVVSTVTVGGLLNLIF